MDQGLMKTIERGIRKIIAMILVLGQCLWMQVPAIAEMNADCITARLGAGDDSALIESVEQKSLSDALPDMQQQAKDAQYRDLLAAHLATLRNDKNAQVAETLPVDTVRKQCAAALAAAERLIENDEIAIPVSMTETRSLKDMITNLGEKYPDADIAAAADLTKLVTPYLEKHWDVSFLTPSDRMQTFAIYENGYLISEAAFVEEHGDDLRISIAYPQWQHLTGGEKTAQVIGAILEHHYRATPYGEAIARLTAPAIEAGADSAAITDDTVAAVVAYTRTKIDMLVALEKQDTAAYNTAREKLLSGIKDINARVAAFSPGAMAVLLRRAQNTLARSLSQDERATLTDLVGTFKEIVRQNQSMAQFAYAFTGRPEAFIEFLLNNTREFHTLAGVPFPAEQQKTIDAVIDETVRELYDDPKAQDEARARISADVRVWDLAHIFPAVTDLTDLQELHSVYGGFFELSRMQYAAAYFDSQTVKLYFPHMTDMLNVRYNFKHELVHYLAFRGELKFDHAYEWTTCCTHVLEVAEQIGADKLGLYSHRLGPVVTTLFKRGVELAEKGEQGLLIESTSEGPTVSLEYLRAIVADVYIKAGMPVEQLNYEDGWDREVGSVLAGIMYARRHHHKVTTPYLRVLQEFFTVVYEQMRPPTRDEQSWIDNTLMPKLTSYARFLLGDATLRPVRDDADIKQWSVTQIGNRYEVTYVPQDTWPRDYFGSNEKERNQKAEDHAFAALSEAIFRHQHSMKADGLEKAEAAGLSADERELFGSLWQTLETYDVIQKGIAIYKGSEMDGDDLQSQKTPGFSVFSSARIGAQIFDRFKTAYDIKNIDVERTVLAGKPLPVQFLNSLMYRRVLGEDTDPRLTRPRVEQALRETQTAWFGLTSGTTWIDSNELFTTIYTQIWPVFKALYDEAVKDEEKKRVYDRLRRDNNRADEPDWDDLTDVQKQQLEDVLEQMLAQMTDDERDALREAIEEMMQQQMQQQGAQTSGQQQGGQQSGQQSGGQMSGGQSQSGQAGSQQSGGTDTGAGQSMPMPRPDTQALPRSGGDLKDRLDQMQAQTQQLEETLSDMQNDITQMSKDTSKVGKDAGTMSGKVSGDQQERAERIATGTQDLKQSAQDLKNKSEAVDREAGDIQQDARANAAKTPSPELGEKTAREAGKLKSATEALADKAGQLDERMQDLADQAAGLKRAIDEKEDASTVQQHLDKLKEMLGKTQSDINDVTQEAKKTFGQSGKLDEALGKQEKSQPLKSDFPSMKKDAGDDENLSPHRGEQEGFSEPLEGLNSKPPVPPLKGGESESAVPVQEGRPLDKAKGDEGISGDLENGKLDEAKSTTTPQNKPSSFEDMINATKAMTDDYTEKTEATQEKLTDEDLTFDFDDMDFEPRQETTVTKGADDLPAGWREKLRTFFASVKKDTDDISKRIAKVLSPDARTGLAGGFMEGADIDDLVDIMTSGNGWSQPAHDQPEDMIVSLFLDLSSSMAWGGTPIEQARYAALILTKALFELRHKFQGFDVSVRFEVWGFGEYDRPLMSFTHADKVTPDMVEAELYRLYGKIKAKDNDTLDLEALERQYDNLRSCAASGVKRVGFFVTDGNDGDNAAAMRAIVEKADKEDDIQLFGISVGNADSKAIVKSIFQRHAVSVKAGFKDLGLAIVNTLFNLSGTTDADYSWMEMCLSPTLPIAKALVRAGFMLKDRLLLSVTPAIAPTWREEEIPGYEEFGFKYRFEHGMKYLVHYGKDSTGARTITDFKMRLGYTGSFRPSYLPYSATNEESLLQIFKQSQKGAGADSGFDSAQENPRVSNDGKRFIREIPTGGLELWNAETKQIMIALDVKNDFVVDPSWPTQAEAVVNGQAKNGNLYLLIRTAAGGLALITYDKNTKGGWQEAERFIFEDRSPNGRLVNLMGESGTGKGELLKAAAHLAQKRLVFVSCHKDMNRGDIVYYATYGEEQDAATGKKYSHLNKGVQEGDWVVLDEFNKISSNVRKELQTSFQERTYERDIEVTGSDGSKTIKAVTYLWHPDARVFLTGNPFDDGRLYKVNKYDDAELRRMDTIEIKWQSPEEELQMLMKLAFPEGTRDSEKKKHLDDFKFLVRWSMTTRLLYLGYDDAARTALMKDWKKFKNPHRYGIQPTARKGDQVGRPISTRIMIRMAQAIVGEPHYFKNRPVSFMKRFFSYAADDPAVCTQEMYANIFRIFEHKYTDTIDANGDVITPSLNLGNGVSVKEGIDDRGTTRCVLMIAPPPTVYTDKNGQQQTVTWDAFDIELHPSVTKAMVEERVKLLFSNPANAAVFYEILMQYVLGNHVCFVGAPGTGKSYFAENGQKLLSGPEAMNGIFARGTKYQDVIEQREIGQQKKGKTGWIRRPLIWAMGDRQVAKADKAYRGQIYRAEELNQGPAMLHAIFNDILQNGRILLRDETEVEAGEGFRVWPTMNHPGRKTQVNPLSGELLDRMVIFEFTDMKPEFEIFEYDRAVQGKLNTNFLGNILYRNTAGIGANGLIAVVLALRMAYDVDQSVLPARPAISDVIPYLQYVLQYYPVTPDDEKPYMLVEEFIRAIHADMNENYAFVCEEFMNAGILKRTNKGEPLALNFDELFGSMPLICEDLGILREANTGNPELDKALNNLQRIVSGASVKWAETIETNIKQENKAILAARESGDWNAMRDHLAVLIETDQIIDQIRQNRSHRKEIADVLKKMRDMTIPGGLEVAGFAADQCASILGCEVGFFKVQDMMPVVLDDKQARYAWFRIQLFTAAQQYADAAEELDAIVSSLLRHTEAFDERLLHESLKDLWFMQQIADWLADAGDWRHTKLETARPEIAAKVSALNALLARVSHAAKPVSPADIAYVRECVENFKKGPVDQALVDAVMHKKDVFMNVYTGSCSGSLHADETHMNESVAFLTGLYAVWQQAQQLSVSPREIERQEKETRIAKIDKELATLRAKNEEMKGRKDVETHDAERITHNAERITQNASIPSIAGPLFTNDSKKNDRFLADDAKKKLWVETQRMFIDPADGRQYVSVAAETSVVIYHSDGTYDDTISCKNAVRAVWVHTEKATNITRVFVATDTGIEVRIKKGNTWDYDTVFGEGGIIEPKGNWFGVCVVEEKGKIVVYGSGWKQNGVCACTDRKTMKKVVGLTDPRGLSVDRQGRIVVAHFGNISLIENGQVIATSKDYAELNGACQAFQDENGYYYVTGHAGHCVLVLAYDETKEGAERFTQVGDPIDFGTENPVGIAGYGGKMYVSLADGNVVELAPVAGTQQTTGPWYRDASGSHTIDKLAIVQMPKPVTFIKEQDTWYVFVNTMAVYQVYKSDFWSHMRTPHFIAHDICYVPDYNGAPACIHATDTGIAITRSTKYNLETPVFVAGDKAFTKIAVHQTGTGYPVIYAYCEDDKAIYRIDEKQQMTVFYELDVPVDRLFCNSKGEVFVCAVGTVCLVRDAAASGMHFVPVSHSLARGNTDMIEGRDGYYYFIADGKVYAQEMERKDDGTCLFVSLHDGPSLVVGDPAKKAVKLQEWNDGLNILWDDGSITIIPPEMTQNATGPRFTAASKVTPCTATYEKKKPIVISAPSPKMYAYPEDGLVYIAGNGREIVVYSKQINTAYPKQLLPASVKDVYDVTVTTISGGRWMFIATSNGVYVYKQSNSRSWGLAKTFGRKGVLFLNTEKYKSVAVAVDGDGNACVYGLEWDGQISRCSGTGTISPVLDAGTDAQSLYYDRDGHLLVLKSGWITTIDQKTNQEIGSSRIEGYDSLRDIVQAADGYYYATDETTGSVVVLEKEISADGAKVHFARVPGIDPIPVGGKPVGIVEQHDGTLLVSTTDNGLFEIAPVAHAGANNGGADLRIGPGQGSRVKGGHSLPSALGSSLTQVRERIAALEKERATLEAELAALKDELPDVSTELQALAAREAELAALSANNEETHNAERRTHNAERITQNASIPSIAGPWEAVRDADGSLVNIVRGKFGSNAITMTFAYQDAADRQHVVFGYGNGHVIEVMRTENGWELVYCKDAEDETTDVGLRQIDRSLAKLLDEKFDGNAPMTTFAYQDAADRQHVVFGYGNGAVIEVMWTKNGWKLVYCNHAGDYTPNVGFDKKPSLAKVIDRKFGTVPVWAMFSYRDGKDRQHMVVGYGGGHALEVVQTATGWKLVYCNMPKNRTFSVYLGGDDDINLAKLIDGKFGESAIWTMFNYQDVADRQHVVVGYGGGHVFEVMLTDAGWELVYCKNAADGTPDVGIGEDESSLAKILDGKFGEKALQSMFAYRDAGNRHRVVGCYGNDHVLEVMLTGTGCELVYCKDAADGTPDVGTGETERSLAKILENESAGNGVLSAFFYQDAESFRRAMFGYAEGHMLEVKAPAAMLGANVPQTTGPLFTNDSKKNDRFLADDAKARLGGIVQRMFIDPTDGRQYVSVAAETSVVIYHSDGTYDDTIACKKAARAVWVHTEKATNITRVFVATDKGIEVRIKKGNTWDYDTVFGEGGIIEPKGNWFGVCVVEEKGKIVVYGSVFETNSVLEKNTVCTCTDRKTMKKVAGLTDPRGLSVDRQGRIVVAHFGNISLVENGQVVATSKDYAELNGASQAFQDENGYYYVTGHAGHCVLVLAYDETKEGVERFTQVGDPIDFGTEKPVGIAGYDGKMYVSLWSGNVVELAPVAGTQGAARVPRNVTGPWYRDALGARTLVDGSQMNQVRTFTLNPDDGAPFVLAADGRKFVEYQTSGDIAEISGRVNDLAWCSNVHGVSALFEATNDGIRIATKVVVANADDVRKNFGESGTVGKGKAFTKIAVHQTGTGYPVIYAHCEKDSMIYKIDEKQVMTKFAPLSGPVPLGRLYCNNAGDVFVLNAGVVYQICDPQPGDDRPKVWVQSSKLGVTDKDDYTDMLEGRDGYYYFISKGKVFVQQMTRDASGVCHFDDLNGALKFINPTIGKKAVKLQESDEGLNILWDDGSITVIPLAPGSTAPAFTTASKQTPFIVDADGNMGDDSRRIFIDRPSGKVYVATGSQSPDVVEYNADGTYGTTLYLRGLCEETRGVYVYTGKNKVRHMYVATDNGLFIMIEKDGHWEIDTNSRGQGHWFAGRKVSGVVANNLWVYASFADDGTVECIDNDSVQEEAVVVLTVPGTRGLSFGTDGNLLVAHDNGVTIVDSLRGTVIARTEILGGLAEAQQVYRHADGHYYVSDMKSGTVVTLALSDEMHPDGTRKLVPVGEPITIAGCLGLDGDGKDLYVSEPLKRTVVKLAPAVGRREKDVVMQDAERTAPNARIAVLEQEIAALKKTIAEKQVLKNQGGIDSAGLVYHAFGFAIGEGFADATMKTIHAARFAAEFERLKTQYGAMVDVYATVFAAVMQGQAITPEAPQRADALGADATCLEAA